MISSPVGGGSVRRIGHSGRSVRHPASMSGRRRAETDAGLLGSMPAARGLGSPFAAPFLAGLIFLGGLAGALPLALDGVVRDDARWVYAATMVACLVLA